MRTAEHADLDTVVDIHIRSRRGYYEGHVPESVLRDWEGRVRAAGYRLDPGPTRRWLCAELDGLLVGFALVTATGRLWQLHVDPDRRGNGVGTALHDACVAALVGLGARRGELDVFVDNHRGREFHRSRGWREVGTTQEEYVHVLMERDLTR
ncbi:hypothetical protein GCM10022243_24640 [Saccharothrix violaceirubra]